MPIPVTCPGCQAKMNAPDAAAGKRVKCPKCQTVLAVPAGPAAPTRPAPPATVKPAAKPSADYELDDEDDAPPRRKPGTGSKPALRPLPKRDDDEDDDRPLKAKRRPARDEDDDDDRPAKAKRRPARDDDEDDYDDEPRPKRGKKKGGKKAGMSGLTIGLIVAGSLVVVGGLGYGAYALFVKDKDGATGGGGIFSSKAKVPDGWKKVDGSAAGFTAHLPADAEELPVNMLAAMPGLMGKGKGKDKKDTTPPMVMKGFGGGMKGDNQGAMALGIKFSPDLPAAQREQVANMFTEMFSGGGPAKGKDKTKVLETKEVPWLGGTAKQTVIEGGEGNDKGVIVIRQVIVGGNVYIGLVGGKGVKAGSDLVNGFFDNFELVK